MRTSKRSKYSALKRWALRSIKLIALCALLSVLLVLALRWFDPPSSAFMLQRQLEAYRATNQTDQQDFRLQHSWVDFDEISPWLPLAVIAAEDQRFPNHFGFDLQQIEAALNDSSGRRRGASTISQQLSKNLFLWPGRHRLTRWTRKGLEAWLTLLAEGLLPKRRILELYLNLAEFGDGIYGADAAARHYFAKSASSLTPREAALLAALLPSPRRYRINPPTDFINQRADWILRQGRQLGGPTIIDKL